MSKNREKNNVMSYSRTKQVNDSFREQVNSSRINEEDLLGKTRAITFLEKTMLLSPVIEEEKGEVLPNYKSKKKGKSKLVLAMLILLLVMLCSSCFFVLFRSKFKDVTIEAGSSVVTKDDFLTSKLYRKNATVKTNLDGIDYGKAGTYDIDLAFKNKNYTVKLFIKDTTAPKVVFQDVYEYTDYKIDPKDFVLDMEDYSEVEYSFKEIDKVNYDVYDDYRINVTVKDIYGNETSSNCILSLGWLKKNVELNAGESDIKQKLVVNKEKDVNKIPDSAIKAIDITTAGSYEVEVNYKGVTYVSNVKVVDDVKPKLELKNVSIYENNTVKLDDFIYKVSDNSGKYKLTLNTTIDYKKIGKQTIEIQAEDPSGNVTVKEATLNIKVDNKGPSFSGLSSVSIKKNGTYDYKKGVKAVDNIDGSVSFTYSDSNVNYSEAGTYYVNYTAVDSKGNKTSVKRQVTIIHDASDTKELVRKYADSLSEDVTTIVNSVRKYIRYSNSWGGNDPVWEGLTDKRGNCFVHAKVLQEVLSVKGIQNKLIWTYDKSHYWNLVYVNGVWRHVDSTPGNNYVLLTDDEMATKYPVTNGGGWDRNSWPSAN